MSKVSVIIPVYNTEKYLRKCLDSVINQTFKNVEIICVYDNSNDSSLNILKEYAKEHANMILLDQGYGSLSAARNAALDVVTGEYVYFLDSDDYIEPTLFEYAMNIFDNFDIDYFCFASKAFCEDTIVQSIDDINKYINVQRDGLFKLNFDIGLNTNIHVWNKIFKISIIKKYKIKFIDKLHYEDIYFTWYYFFVSAKAYFDNEFYHHYRISSNSSMEIATSHKTFENGIEHMYNWHELMLTFAQNKELFIKNYDNLSHLLNIYTNRTKEMIPASNKYKAELLKIKYQNEIFGIHNSFIEEEKIKIMQENATPMKYSFFERVFSIKNSKDKKHKIICILGTKIKVKKGKLCN